MYFKAQTLTSYCTCFFQFHSETHYHSTESSLWSLRRCWRLDTSLQFSQGYWRHVLSRPVSYSSQDPRPHMWCPPIARNSRARFSPAGEHWCETQPEHWCGSLRLSRTPLWARCSSGSRIQCCLSLLQHLLRTSDLSWRPRHTGHSACPGTVGRNGRVVSGFDVCL